MLGIGEHGAGEILFRYKALIRDKAVDVSAVLYNRSASVAVDKEAHAIGAQAHIPLQRFSDGIGTEHLRREKLAAHFFGNDPTAVHRSSVQEKRIPFGKLTAAHADGSGGAHGVEGAVWNRFVAGRNGIFEIAVALRGGFKGIKLGSIIGNGAEAERADERFLHEIFPCGSADPADEDTCQRVHHILILPFIPERRVGL